jgi:hypothetical protein
VTTALHPLPPETLRGLVGALAGPIEAATLAVVRLDERLGCCDPALAAGVCERAHVSEALALAQLAGESVALEDLVLHDNRLDARAPGTGTVRAARILRERRAFAERAPASLLAEQAVRRLAGAPTNAASQAAPALVPASEPAPAPSSAPSSAPWAMPSPGLTDEADDVHDDLDPAWDDDPDNHLDSDRADGASRDAVDVDLAAIDRLLARTRAPLLTLPQPGAGQEPELQEPELQEPRLRLRDPGYGAAARVDRWLAALAATQGCPGAMAAAVALDAWLSLEPAERGGEAGWMLAATVLRQRGLARHHLPALALAYRKGRFRWSPHQALERRLEGLLAVVGDGARLADADLKRLTLAREVMMRRCEGRRENARLPELVGLFVALPVVTTTLAARRLDVTPQGVEAMLRELGPSLPRELTGRKRYRAWGIV